MNVKIRTEKLNLKLISVFWHGVNCIFQGASLSLEMGSSIDGHDYFSLFFYYIYNKKNI